MTTQTRLTDPLAERGDDLGDLETLIRGACVGGVALEGRLRDALEGAFGTDLDALRIHHDQPADAICRRLDAEAVTAGADIFFCARSYAPQSRRGLKLLAHEVVHAVEQAGRRRPRSFGPHISEPGDGGERLAERASEAFTAGRMSSRRVCRHLRRLNDEDALILQRHASWEHYLLGDAPPADLDAIAKKLPNRRALLEARRDFLWMWNSDPESVTERDIQARYSYVRTVRLKASGLLVTYGELNTLPDYMANPTVLDAQPKSILLPILQSVRQESYNRVLEQLGDLAWRGQFRYAVAYNLNWDFYNLLAETRALDALTKDLAPNGTNHYTALVGRNACHFAPQSWFRWQQFYLIARQYASDAYKASSFDTKAQLTYNAWLNHGYADHFLQDSFAAGHLVNKTLVMQWFVEWATNTWTVWPADWSQIKTITTQNQPGLAARNLYNRSSPGQVRDPQTAEEQVDLATRMNVSGVRATQDLTQLQAYRNYLKFLNGTIQQSASGVLHDHFNKTSLTVTSPAISSPFQIWGDDTMLYGGDGVKIASETAQMSQQSIAEILHGGTTSITMQAIFDRLPASVWAGRLLTLEQWNDGQRGKAEELFEDVHYYLLKAFPRIGNISRDAMG